MKKEFGGSKFKKVITTILTTTLLVTTLAANSGNLAYAATDAWNDASSSTTTGTTLDDGSVVYPNVYADPKEWSEWKTSWKKIRTNYEQVTLTPGNDATELNFAWYSHTVEKPAVRLTDSQGNPTGETNVGSQETNSMSITENSITTNLYPCKVTITGLKEQTIYYYQYFLNGGWSDTYTYSTQRTDSFSVLFVGDPQIGNSYGYDPVEANTFANDAEYFVRNDAYNWNHTLKRAVTDNKNLSFMISVGDNINHPSFETDYDKLEQQVEYVGFLSSPVLRSLPIASAIGNHDSYSLNYKNHFNNPNSYTEEADASIMGDDYYFSYGKALFVVLNANNKNCQTHKDLIDKAMAAVPDAKWKILVFHQDIYGSGAHSNSTGYLTKNLTPIIDNAGFDMVIQGHQHTYSRTYQLSSDGISANISCYNTDGKNKVINPKGTVYFDANSSTGSRFFPLLSTQQNFIAARNQSWRPTYSMIYIDEVSLTVKTYDAATHQEIIADGGIETAYTIVKPVDKSNLEAKITEVEQQLINGGNDKQKSIANLKQILESAKVILSDPEAGSADVENACVSVLEAVNAIPKDETDKPVVVEKKYIVISVIAVVCAGIVIGIFFSRKRKG